MNRHILSPVLLVGMALASSRTLADDFRWGAASAAYQVEGATTADGKGPSVWDDYLDNKGLAGPGVSGAVAIDFYNREQYLKDIALMKQMGLTSYRFSVSWPRIIPNGLGSVNPAAIAHYRQFIVDLCAAGIKPMMTLYHWDMPLPLARAGGWKNRDSVKWFSRYAGAVFDNFHDLVDLYALVNEPLVERAMTVLAEERMRNRSGTTEPKFEIIPSAANLDDALRSFNNLMLASAAAKQVFDDKGYKGELGLALPLFPTLSGPDASPADKEAVEMADGVMNRWFLDAIYRGEYPKDVLAALGGRDVGIQPEDAARIKAAKFDYLGINFYAPLFIRRPSDAAADGYAAESFVPPGTFAALNGPVRPDQFKALLDRVRTDYGNTPVYITGNGAGLSEMTNWSTALSRTGSVAAMSSIISPRCKTRWPQALVSAAIMSGRATTTWNGFSGMEAVSA
jgi:beta-glucosidase